MLRESFTLRSIAKKILSLISGFICELGFFLFIILLGIGVTSLVAFILSMVG